MQRMNNRNSVRARGLPNVSRQTREVIRVQDIRPKCSDAFGYKGGCLPPVIENMPKEATRRPSRPCKSRMGSTHWCRIDGDTITGLRNLVRRCCNAYYFNLVTFGHE